jgi:hypothetical protein
MESNAQCSGSHMNDLKASHVDEDVNKGVLVRLNVEFGKETLLTVTRGNIHGCLGMLIDHSADGKAMKPNIGDYKQMCPTLQGDDLKIVKWWDD